MEVMNKEELLNRLYEVYQKATEITGVLAKQTDLAAKYRHDRYQELDHVDKSLMNKGKYLFLALFLAHTLTVFVTTMLFRHGWYFSTRLDMFFDAVIFNVVAVIFIFAVLWKRKSKAALALRVFLMVVMGLDFAGSLLSWARSIFLGNFLGGSLSILIMVGTAILFFRLLQHLNSKVDRQNVEIRKSNAEIERRNEEIARQYDQLSEQLVQRRAEMTALCYGWYQVDDCFYTVEGIQSLIRVLENQEADTLKEAIKTVREQDYRQRMLAYQEAILQANHQQLINQEEIKRQLRYANVLAATSVALQVVSNAQQAETNRLLSQQNASQARTNSLLSRQNERLRDINDRL